MPTHPVRRRRPLFLLATALLAAVFRAVAQSEPPGSPDEQVLDEQLDERLVRRLDPAGFALPPAGEEGIAADPGYTPFGIPDQTFEVFNQRFDDGNWELYRTNVGGIVRLTVHPGADIHPALNRGNTEVLFASNRDGDFEIYPMNLDGGGWFN